MSEATAVLEPVATAAGERLGPRERTIPGAADCEQLRRFVAEVSPLTGALFLAGLLRHLGEALGARLAFVAEASPLDAECARSVAAWAGGRIVRNFAYPVRRVPCRLVLADGEACLESGVAERFDTGALPGGGDLDAYCGVKLYEDADAAAWLAVLFAGGDPAPAAARSQLRLHAARAAAELRRLRAEAQARRASARLTARAEALGQRAAQFERELQAAVAERERAGEGLRRSDERFAKAFRASPGLLSLSTRGEGRFLEVNDSFLRTTGYRREEVVGRTGAELGLWHEPAERDRLARLLQVEGALRDRELLFVTKAGELRVALLSAETIEIGDEPCVLTAAIDITERQRAEAALRESEERYALAARGANDGLWDWNLATGDVYFSPRWKQMLGYADGDVGSRPSQWSARIHPEDRDKVAMEILAHLEGLTAHFESEHRILHADGGYRHVLCRGLAVRDAFDRAYRFAGSQTDVTLRKQAESQLIHDAFHDALTGLPNRALFLDRLGRALERARRRGGCFAVLLLDLDRFKLVTDSLGHSVGDRLLTVVAARIAGCLRPEDSVARLGGDEFAVLIEDIADASDATRVANRLDEALRLPLDVGGQEVFSSVSVGIAVSEPGYERPEELLRDADTALYRAKAQGGGRCAVFDPVMHQRAVARLQLETDLRRAVERQEFRVAYQPIVSLRSGALAGFEALLRWQHPARGAVAPQEFVPVAEETGLIVPLGLWVLRAACRQGRQWQERFGNALTISVNLSGRQLMQPDLFEQVAAILDDSGLDGKLLKLEVTETVIVDNAEAASATLARLKGLGVDVSVDDFGTGHSCLSLLHQFPIDTLKADRSFVGRIGVEGDGDETLRTIITLARNLRMQVVAEGVETPEQLAALRRLDCPFGQGHLFSQALEAEAAERLIAAARRW